MNITNLLRSDNLVSPLLHKDYKNCCIYATKNQETKDVAYKQHISSCALKVCIKCNEAKSETNFYTRKNRQNQIQLRNICKDCDNLRKKQSYLNNREYVLKKAENYRNENLEKTRLAVSIYKKAHPEKAIKHEEEYLKRRYQRQIDQSDGTLTTEFLRKLFGMAKSCPYCNAKFSKKVVKSLDHVIPLSKGGLHSASNVLICCKPCNTQKSNKIVNLI